MKNINIKNIKKITSALVAGFVLMTSSNCKAATKIANAELDSRNIIYQNIDSESTNFLINAENVLRNGLSEEQKKLNINETLLIDSLNEMLETVLNYNISNLFNDPCNYKYLSLGIYLDNEEEKNIVLGIGKLVEEYSLDPTNNDLLCRLINIFGGRDSEFHTSLLSVGGKEALANDVYFVNALVQVYNITEYIEMMNDISLSYGENGDIIAFINAIKGESCKTK